MCIRYVITIIVLNSHINDCRSEEEGEDEVDSDFDIEENDEPISENEEEQPKRKRKRLVTKAYRVSRIN